jgi:hypothetical protein
VETPPGKELLIAVTGEQPIWEQLKRCDEKRRSKGDTPLLKPGLTRERFEEELTKGFEKAVKDMENYHRVAPEAGELQQLQTTIFSKVLEKEFCLFRPGFDTDRDSVESLAYARMQCGSILDVPKNEKELRDSKTEQKFRIAKPEEKLQKICNYHSAVMQLKPCNDPTENSVINRTVAFAVMEGQLKLGFIPQEQLKLSIDARAHKEALDYRDEFASMRKLSGLVKEVIGPTWNVIDMQQYRNRRG